VRARSSAGGAEGGGRGESSRQEAPSSLPLPDTAFYSSIAASSVMSFCCLRYLLLPPRLRYAGCPPATVCPAGGVQEKHRRRVKQAWCGECSVMPLLPDVLPAFAADCHAMFVIFRYSASGGERKRCEVTRRGSAQGGAGGRGGGVRYGGARRSVRGAM